MEDRSFSFRRRSENEKSIQIVVHTRGRAASRWLLQKSKKAVRYAGSMHCHIVLIWLVLLLRDVGVARWGRCDGTSWCLMISFDLISIHEVLSFRCDWRCHVTIDHVAVRLLWRARESIDWDWLLRRWFAWRCRRGCLSVHDLLLLEEVIEGGRDSRHVR